MKKFKIILSKESFLYLKFLYLQFGMILRTEEIPQHNIYMIEIIFSDSWRFSRIMEGLKNIEWNNITTLEISSI